MTEREKIPLEELTEINQGEFILMLSQALQGMVNDIVKMQNIPNEIRLHQNAGFNVLFYKDKQGYPIMVPVKKKQLGFNT